MAQENVEDPYQLDGVSFRGILSKDHVTVV